MLLVVRASAGSNHQPGSITDLGHFELYRHRLIHDRNSLNLPWVLCLMDDIVILFILSRTVGVIPVPEDSRRNSKPT
jgi:hypothetical protein